MESASGKHQEYIERLIARAVEQAVREAKGRWLRPGRNPFVNLADIPRDGLARSFRRSLDGALVRLANQPGRPSIRMAAPDTGGRSFHFGHVAVSRFTCGLSADQIVPSTRKAGSRKARDKSHTTRCSEYMQYMEREEAAERGREALASSVIDAGRERSPWGLQAYLEDPAKEPERAIAGDGLSPPLRSIFSSIGETLEERMAFWDYAEARAKGEKSTIQHRFIIELPHEAAAEDRVAIVEELVKLYKRDKIPYAAVLHAPTARNDQRNFHLHVALLAYPAWVEKWPAGGKDARHPERPLVDTWTFAATETRYNRKRRSFETVNPFKKETVIPEYYRRDFVRSERRRVADIVNARMVSTGNPIRYDHRSYKAMGLDVEPMQSISRMIADKSKDGKVAILDEKRLKREIELELDRLAQARAPAFTEVKAVHAAARAGERSLRAVEKEAALVGGRVIRRTGAAPDPEFVKARACEYARRRWRHLDHSIAADHELKTIRRVIEATDPVTTARWRDHLARRLWRARASRDPLAVERLWQDRELIPDRFLSDALQSTAREHLDERKAVLEASARRMIARANEALAAWRRAAAGERLDLNPGAPAQLPRVHGVPLQVKPAPVPVKIPAPNPRPIWMSAYDVLDSVCKTPHEKFALALFRRFSQFIVENSSQDVPGRTPLDLCEKLIAAVKEGPAKTEALLADYQPGAPSHLANRPAPERDVGNVAAGMADNPLRVGRLAKAEEPIARSAEQGDGANGEGGAPARTTTQSISRRQGEGRGLEQPGEAAGLVEEVAIKAKEEERFPGFAVPEDISLAEADEDGADKDELAGDGKKKRRKKRNGRSSPGRSGGWEL